MNILYKVIVNLFLVCVFGNMELERVALGTSYVMFSANFIRLSCLAVALVELNNILIGKEDN